MFSLIIFVLSFSGSMMNMGSASAGESKVCGLRGEDAGHNNKVTLCRCMGNYYSLSDDANPCLLKSKLKEIGSQSIPHGSGQIRASINREADLPVVQYNANADLEVYLSTHRPKTQDFEISSGLDKAGSFEHDQELTELNKHVAKAELEDQCMHTPEAFTFLTEIFQKAHAFQLEEKTDFAAMAGRTYRVCGYNAILNRWFESKYVFKTTGGFVEQEANCEIVYRASSLAPFRFEPSAGCNSSGLRAGGGLGDVVFTSIGQDAYIQKTMSLDEKAIGYFLLLPMH